MAEQGPTQNGDRSSHFAENSTSTAEHAASDEAGEVVDNNKTQESSVAEEFFLGAVSSAVSNAPSQDEEEVEFSKDSGELAAANSKKSSTSSKEKSVVGRFSKKIRFRGASSAVSDSDRSDGMRRTTHLRKLYRQRRKKDKLVERSMRKLIIEEESDDDDKGTVSTSDDISTDGTSTQADVEEHAKELGQKARDFVALFVEWNEAMGDRETEFMVPLEVRLDNFSYSVQIAAGSDKIQTVYNASCVYYFKNLWKRWVKGEKLEKHEPVTKNILDRINLVIEPGKSYLILGPPGAGKSSLLRAISGRVRPSARKRQNKSQSITGKILYNGLSIQEGGDEFHIQNVIQYIDQLDKHAPRLTVRDTFDFAFQTKAGGTIFREKDWLDEKQRALVEKYDQEHLRVWATLVALGLEEVADTFVGNTQVRGVSGGQRRRVTVGEMVQERVPVLCGDEISTGLDATSTYEMIELMLHFSGSQRNSRVISLLQPSPETVSLFDEVIVLSQGRIIFTGPIMKVEEYFASLGFKAPEHMDVADFLQLVSNEGCAEHYDPPPEMADKYPKPPTGKDLAEIFDESEWGKRVEEKVTAPHKYVWKPQHGDAAAPGDCIVSRVAELEAVKNRYANSTLKNTWLVFRRFLLLWTRDKRVIYAGAAKNILMGVSVGGVFSNNENPVDLLGALFQAGLFIMLSAMQNASSLVVDRPIFFKHAESNFYSSVPFVLGRTMSTVPQTITDVVWFGTLLYYIIGLADRTDAGNFFIYLAILITFAFAMQQQLAVFASFAGADTLQVLSAVTLLFYILFGGYIIAPDTIPNYYYWAFWMNPFAWAYRALVVNEFRSGRWEDPDEILTQLGFTLPGSGDPYGKVWIGWSFLYNGCYFLVSTFLSALGLAVAHEAVIARTTQRGEASLRHNASTIKRTEIPFRSVNLSFHDICYDVTASTGSNKLRLLHSVNGIFRPGRMCALMGTSGAGKTTLMDVIALRKRTGEITGDVRLNGWPQEAIPFRRCSGYVEQFDVQSPELTIRETVLFSARLRLDPDLFEEKEDLDNFVDRVLEAVCLQDIDNALVGTEDTGLTFEQRKLLSIAVELAASPSVIFLDEPTSGLDSKAALIVVNTLRRIANDDRTIVATIHQPSSSVFEMFDELLLLKKGGHVVYHGELGTSSSALVNYFHSMGAPRIGYGENPANWMLKVMAMDTMQDLDQRWLQSEQFNLLKQELGKIYTNRPDPDKKIQYESEFAAPRRRRRELVSGRLRLIYWRSPTYNLSRLLVSAVIAFILGSVFITERRKTVFSEVQMRARFSVIFLTFIIIGIMAILSVIPVMTKIRDMFYRHRAAGTYDSLSVGWALGSAEKLFIVVSSTVFVFVFQVTGSLNNKFYRGFIGFWGFFTFNFAIYSYFGQAFVALVEPSATAIILSSVFIGLNNFFSGLIVRPQLMVGNFYAFPYYICPGHYVYEGLIVTLYRDDDDSTVVADEDSEFYNDLGCNSTMTSPCEGSINQYIDSFFGGNFDESHILRNGLILGFILVLTRLSTWLALKYIKYG